MYDEKKESNEKIEGNMMCKEKEETVSNVQDSRTL